MLGRTLKTITFAAFLSLLATAQTIPAGTHITVRTAQELTSGSAKVGERFDATLTRALVVGGKTLAKAGAPARGKVTVAKSSGRLHAPGQLSVRLTSVQIEGRMVPISTGSYHLEGKSHTKSNATKIGGGAAVGALIGGLAGGGKGAAIGAGAGGAAGTGVAAATGKEEAIIPAEKAISFTTAAAAKVK
ncbi:MAG: hypothetical protein WA628_12275 [Terriglobales bacterium]